MIWRFQKSVLREIFGSKHRCGIKMDAEEVDERNTVKVKGLIGDNQWQLLQEMNSLMQKISDPNCSSNEEHILKISNIVATGEMPKFKGQSNEEHSSSHRTNEFRFINPIL